MMTRLKKNPKSLIFNNLLIILHTLIVMQTGIYFASLLLNISTLYSYRLSTSGNKLIKKLLIFPNKANFARCLFIAFTFFESSICAQHNDSQGKNDANLTTLTFDIAVQRTLNHSLVLNQARSEAQGRKGLVTQAGLYPNPSFGYVLENSQYGWKQRQDSYVINQLVELGGKREKLVKFATYEYYAASIGYETSTLNQLNQLSKAFVRLVAAQELAQLAVQHQKNAEEAFRLIHIKVEVGKATRIQLNKAHIARSLADLNVKKSITEFRTAKNSLALFWSSVDPDFDQVIFPLFEISEPHSLEEYLNKLCDQPEVAQSLYTYMAAYQNLRFEKAARIPDVTLSIGYGYDQGNKGVVAGVSVPLPIWNRNQGNIQNAYQGMLKAEDQTKQIKVFLKNKLSNAYLELKQAYQDVQDLRDLILEASSQNLYLAHEGYKEGKLEYWEVLNAQQSFLEAQEKHIQALVEYHNRRAEIDYLTSVP